MFNPLIENLNKKISENQYEAVTTIDAHTGGEPLRIIISGFDSIKGKTVLERRNYCKENLDQLRKSIMWEPRGHADMYGAILMPPIDRESDFSVLFTHNEGYSTMCGHAIIALTKVFSELGFKKSISNKVHYQIEVPAGIVQSTAIIEKR